MTKRFWFTPLLLILVLSGSLTREVMGQGRAKGFGSRQVSTGPAAGPVAIPASEAASYSWSATPEMTRQLRERYPDQVPTQEAFEVWMRQARGEYQTLMSTWRDEGEVLRIPVVIHIIHNGEAEGSGFNISREQAESQIRVLNEDFRRIAGSRGLNRHPAGADTRIEFVLARRDPQGRPTEGIVRWPSSAMGFPPPYTLSFMDRDVKLRTVWDTRQYLNLWCAPLSGTMGYATPPRGARLPGVACSLNSYPDRLIEGVVVTTRAFGSRDGANGALFNLAPESKYGRRVTHEVGRFLSLLGTWGDARCGTDYCEDTPPQEGPTVGYCPAINNFSYCGLGQHSGPEMFENYMDLTTDSCQNIFTRDQAVRMRVTLLYDFYRRSLINSVALTDPAAVDVSLVSLTGLGAEVCPGPGKRVRATIVNAGQLPLTSAEVVYRIGEGAPQSVSYRGNLATGDTAGMWLSLPNLAVGAQVLTVYVSQPNGQADASGPTDTLRIGVMATAGRGLPMAETFEHGDPSPAGWQVGDPDAGCATWRIVPVTRGRHNERTQAAFLNLSDYGTSTGQRDILYFPRQDLRGTRSGWASFHYCFAASENQHNVRLVLEYSTDCDDTWTPVPEGEWTGGVLQTVGRQTQSTPFNPTSGNNWRTASVWLGSTLVGQAGRLRLVCINGSGGHSLYVDNIAVTRFAPAAPSFQGFFPDSGYAGDTVILTGRNLGSTVEVWFRGQVQARILSQTDSIVRVIVPERASSGSLRILSLGNPNSGFVISHAPFRVLEAPELLEFSPIANFVGGHLSLRGRGLGYVTRVEFTGGQSVTIRPPLFPVEYQSISLRVPPGAQTGPVSVHSRFGSDTSTGPFFVTWLYTLQNNFIHTCEGIWQSTSSGRYQNNRTWVQTIRPWDPGTSIQVSFQRFRTEGGFDTLTIFDGPTTDSHRLGVWSGTNSPGVVKSSHPTGMLTFRFRTNATINDEGWEAYLACVPMPAPIIDTLMPGIGAVGAQVALGGRFFGMVTEVTMSGRRIPFVRQGGNLVVTIPPGAVTGRFEVVSPEGRSVSPRDFIVVPGPHYCPSPFPSSFSLSRRELVEITRLELDGTPLQPMPAASIANVSPVHSLYWGGDSATPRLQGGGMYTLRIATSVRTALNFWIDANANGMFDFHEQLAGNNYLMVDPTGVDAHFRLPYRGGLLPQYVRIRIKVGQGGISEPCSPLVIGQTQDYLVFLSPCETLPPMLSIQSTSRACRSQPFTIVMGGARDPSQVFWYTEPNAGRAIDTGLTHTRVADPQRRIYQVFVAQTAGLCQSERVLVDVPIDWPPSAHFSQRDDTLFVSGLPIQNAVYRWRLNGVDIPGGNGPRIKTGLEGTYTLVVQRLGCTDSTSRFISKEALTGVLPGAEVSVYPNPVSGILTIGSTVTGRFRLVDVTGRVALEGALVPGRMRIPAALLPSGNYRLQVDTEGQRGPGRLRIPVQVVH